MKVLGYVLVFGLLVSITAAEVSIISLGFLTRSLIVTTLIGLAGVKALFVAAYFQHLKDEPRSLSVVLVAGVAIATVLMVISFLQLHPIHV